MTKKETILSLINQVMRKHITTGKVFVFGSQANKEEFIRADIDVGFESKQEIPFKTYLKIKNELEELPTLFKFDLVDFSKVSKQFKKVAYQNIELL